MKAPATGSLRARRRVLVVGGVAALSGVALLMAAQGAAQPKARPAAEKQPTTADMAHAKRQAFEITTTALGDLQAKNQIELRSKLEQSAAIQFIIPEGTRVKKGDLLCRLNTDNLQREIDQQTPALTSAKAQLVAAENTYQIQINDNTSNLRKAELALDLAELALRQWREGDAVKERKQLLTGIQTSELELQRLADQYARSQALYAEGFLSKNECDQDERSYIEAISRYQTAVLELDVFDRFSFPQRDRQKMSDVEEARAEVERVRLNNAAQLASRSADVDNQREQVKLTEARLAKLNEQKASAEITAPQDGMVVYQSSVEGFRWGGNDGPLQIGQEIYPNQLIIALPDTSTMVGVVRVHEALAGNIRPGQEATLKVDAAGGRVFTGRVESIGVMAESGGWGDRNLREYTVRIAIDSSPSDELKPAMRVESRLVLDRVGETLTVPIQAVYSEGPVQFVYKPEGNKFTRVPVRVGKRSDTIAEILGGLAEGEVALLRKPAPGEVISKPWDREQLLAAGYTLDDNGQVLAQRGPGKGGPKPTTVAREQPTEPVADAKPVEAAPAAATTETPGVAAQPAGK